MTVRRVALLINIYSIEEITANMSQTLVNIKFEQIALAQRNSFTFGIWYAHLRKKKLISKLSRDKLFHNDRALN